MVDWGADGQGREQVPHKINDQNRNEDEVVPEAERNGIEEEKFDERAEEGQ